MIPFLLFVATALLVAASAVLFWMHPTPVAFGCLVFTVLMSAFTGILAVR